MFFNVKVVLRRKMHVQKAQTCQAVEIFREEFPKKYHPQLL